MPRELDTNLRPALEIDLDRVALPPVIKRATVTLNTTGWFGFWGQILLGAIALLLLGFASISLSVGSQPDKWGMGFSITLAISAMIALALGIYWSFRYTRLAKQLQFSAPGLAPSQTETTKILWIGLLVNLVGIGLALLGSEAISSSILVRTLAEPEGVVVYAAAKQVRPLDVVLVLANVNLIAAHFLGIAASLWSLKLVGRD